MHQLRRASLRKPFFRFTALALMLSTVTTGIVNRHDAPGKPHVKVMAAKKLAVNGHASAGFDSVQDIDGAEMVALTYNVAPGSPEPTIQVRGEKDGQWTEWLDVSADSADGPDADSPEHKSSLLSTTPSWLGHDQQHAEVRVTEGDVTDLELHPIDSEAQEATGSALAIPSADAFVPVGWVISRAQWGADEADSYTQPGCEAGVQYAPGGVTRAHIHHTVNSNSYGPGDSAALVRGIQAYHIFNNGWCDIGYNFLVDRYGQVFEGRRGGTGRAVIGSHASGFNTGSTGIALIGDFTNSGVPDATYSSLVNLLAWKFAYHGIPAEGQVWVRVGANDGAYWPEGTVVSLDRITGHRDVNATGCPGNFMYALLPQLRADVQAILDAQPQEQRIACDFDGNGTDTPAVFYGGRWWIRNSNTEGPPEGTFVFGNPGDIALCGDWYHTGHDGPAVYRGGFLYMRRDIWQPDDVTSVAWYGDPGDVPVVGDWNGDGFDTIAVVRGDRWYITNSYLPWGTLAIRFGNPGDTPIAGDWTRKGYDSVGIARPGQYVESDKNATSFGDRTIMFGDPTDRPLVGDWNGDRITTPGLNRGTYWWLLGANNTNASMTSFLFWPFG